MLPSSLGSTTMPIIDRVNNVYICGSVIIYFPMKMQTNFMATDTHMKIRVKWKIKSQGC